MLNSANPLVGARSEKWRPRKTPPVLSHASLGRLDAPPHSGRSPATLRVAEHPVIARTFAALDPGRVSHHWP
jgi:hypothetical protein